MAASNFPPECPLSGGPTRVLTLRDGSSMIVSSSGWSSILFPSVASLRGWCNNVVRLDRFAAGTKFRIVPIPRRDPLSGNTTTDYQPQGNKWLGPRFSDEATAIWWSRHVRGVPPSEKPGVTSHVVREKEYSVDEGLEPATDAEVEGLVSSLQSGGGRG